MTFDDWPRKHKPPSRLKTYTHLAGARRIPTDYEIATTRLHYYVDRGFEVRMPASGWYEKYQRGSPLRAADWDSFADPRQTTYSDYVKRRRANEAHLDGIFRTIEAAEYDRDLDAEWLRTLSGYLGPLRYPFHGLQMVAAYVGAMAPSSRITVVALFQAADTMRLVQRLAHRMMELRRTDPTFGVDAASIWQNDPRWQPLRRLVEELLVTYDWGEALVALNVCARPAVDDLFMERLAELAKRRGDPQFQAFCASFWDDFAWQRDWTSALLECAFADGADCRRAVDGWKADWSARVAEALSPFQPALPATEPRPVKAPAPLAVEEETP